MTVQFTPLYHKNQCLHAYVSPVRIQTSQHSNRLRTASKLTLINWTIHYVS